MKLFSSQNHLTKRKLVVVLVANIKQFRTSFYEKLYSTLGLEKIDLLVIYSDVSESEKSKADSVDLPKPLGLKVKGSYFFRDRILFQFIPLITFIKADLIVVVQSNGYLMNYLLQLFRLFGWGRLAFWGHGYNHQSEGNTFLEKFKRLTASQVDWWFAYTKNTADYLIRVGYTKEKITIINNAIDTTNFSKQVDGVTQDQRCELINKLNFSDDVVVGIYCGSLYANKRLDFLLEASEIISSKHKNFKLLVIGDGDEKQLLETYSKKVDWLIYCGPQFGIEKSIYFSIADFFLNPGLVGLAILDSFAAGLPFITTDFKGHSPEIAYLEDGTNGLMLPFDTKHFANGVSDLINHPDNLFSLKQGAMLSSKKYTVENMVENVSAGILKFIEFKKRDLLK